ncbi:MAG TPA: hypothetical protein VGM18_04500 [Candidatus Sulfotelmatobacter sp.]|jgi:hypothetical protein
MANRLVPAGRTDDYDFIGRLDGVFKIVGDIESPVDPLEAWLYDLNNLDLNHLDSELDPQS